MRYFSDAPQREQDELERTASILAALAHPVRLRLVEGLLMGECCVGNMVECLGLPQPLVSRHLAVLREAGVVRDERQGRRRQYSVVDPRAAQLVRCLFGPAPVAERNERKQDR